MKEADSKHTDPGFAGHEMKRLAKSGLLGSGFFFILFLYSLALHGGFTVLGVEDERLDAVTTIFMDNFVLDIVLVLSQQLILHLAVGFLLGILAGALARRLRSRLGILVGVHLLFYFREMAQSPQLYYELWLAKGGARKAVQCAVTDFLNPTIIEFFLGAIFAAALIRLIIRFRAAKASAVAASIAIGIFGMSQIPFDNVLAKPAHAGKTLTQPNVIMIGLDSLRPDRLSANAYHRDTTPIIDAVINEGVVFENCYSPLPRTFPAIVSLMTGTTPLKHGVRTMFPRYEHRAFLPETIADKLRNAGYKTVVISDFAGDIFPRVDLGFDEIDAPNFTILTLAELRVAELMTNIMPYVNNTHGRKLLPILEEFAHNADPKPLTDKVIQKLDELAKDEPFFLKVFYSTTHFPFAPPWPYYKKYTDPTYKGAYRYHKFTIPGKVENLTVADKNQISALYDGCLRAVDDQIARILSHLEKSGLAQNTLLVFFGDHGEDLFETPNTPVQHGEQLRTEFSMKTTAIFAGPGIMRGRHVKKRIRLIDIAPTIAEYTAMSRESFMGRSLMPFLHGESMADTGIYVETGLWYDAQGEAFYNQLHIQYPDVTKILEVDSLHNHEMVIQRQWEDLTNYAKHRVWIADDMKLIKMPMVDGVGYELYDLRDDPLCERDLSGVRPMDVERLSAQLENYLQGAY